MEPGHAEVYAVKEDGQVYNVTNHEGWKPIASITDMSLAGVPGAQLVLKEALPAMPDAGVVNFIQDNSGGTSSPHVFAAPAPKSDYSGPRFPPAPPGTTRVTVDVGGSLYFPLRADCAQGCSDAVAHAIDDPGTRAYEKALVDQMKRDGVMFGLSLINPFQRGFGLVAGAGRSVAVGEVTGLAREAGAAGVGRAVTAGEASVSGLVNKVGTVTSAEIDAALQTTTKGKGAITLSPGTGASTVYYEGTKPLTVVQGEIAPAFEKIGGGIKVLPNVANSAERGALGNVSTKPIVPEYAPGFNEADILAMPKGARLDPTFYLTQAHQDAHAALFQGGAVRIQPTAPTGTIGRTETWVFPNSLANDAIANSGGDVRVLEKMLGLDSGYLGNAPVRVDIPKPVGYKIPTGNEFGANSFWRPGGATAPGGCLKPSSIRCLLEAM